jgi:hypothetical protein
MSGFILNLCPVAGPVAIPQPRSPNLTRFSFFCSRGWEGQREQYWLHMGYFPTRADAQKWLDLLRGVYPEAFVAESEETFATEYHAEHEITRRKGPLT